MEQHSRPVQPPGGTVLGGAASGFSYEGVRCDALAREEADLGPNFFRSLRMDRGGNFQTLEALRTGTANAERAAITVGDVALGPIIYLRGQASILRLMTETLQAEGKPFREQVALFDVLDTRMKLAKSDAVVPDAAWLLMPATQKIAHACHRTTVRIRCARAGLLAEVFRLRNGRLPASVEELCASLKVPILLDPWDDKPLKWKPDGEGVSVYSVGADGIDDGGRRHPKNYDEAGHDLVFRIPLSRNPQP